MAFDFKKEYRELYAPPKTPGIIEIPKMNFVAVRGTGNPNEEDGAYSRAVGLLYGVTFTIKMSHKGPHRIEGFHEYAVPPLEGFWWQPGVTGIDYAHKENFHWISVMRLPDFVTPAVFEWAVAEAARKKKTDFSAAELFTYDEGPCVQCMHHGPYDDEPATILAMEQYAREAGYAIDITDQRLHHEIYLSDPRKTAPDRLKTVIRHPVRKV